MWKYMNFENWFCHYITFYKIDDTVKTLKNGHFYVPGSASVGSRHHLVMRGFSTGLGLLNLRLQTSLGMMVHSWAGFKLGTNLVSNLQVFCGFKSQTSSGISTREVTVLSWHSSAPSSATQPAPQISTGNFSQEVSPTNLPTN